MIIEIKGVKWKYRYGVDPNKRLIHDFIQVQNKESKLTRSRRDAVEREFKRQFIVVDERL